MIDYEQALISACVRDAEVFHSTRALRLTAEAFQNPQCAAVWDALCRNADSGVPHNGVELGMRIAKDYPDRHKEIHVFLADAERIAKDTTAHATWARHVAEQWAERLKKDAWQEGAARVHAGESVVEVTRDILEKIARADDKVALEEDKLERTRKAVQERVRERISGSGGMVRTGISVIDRQLGVFQTHEFIVLAARPGCGKSSLARQLMIDHVRVAKTPVLMFSLEMSVDQVVQAMASQNCGVSSWRIEDDFDNRKERLIAECERFAGALGRYFFIHDDIYRISEIEQTIHIAARRHKPSLIVIDYLQLVEPPHQKGMNREQQVAYISRHLKQIAQMHRIPIVALAQMGREYEKENRKPRLSDLRESGSLEQDADRVWFLHHDSKAEPVGGVLPMQLIQEKCRAGSQCTLDVGFKKDITKFLFEKVGFGIDTAEKE